LRMGDVVVAALGDGARPAGRACTIPEAVLPGIVKADCFRVRVPGDALASEFLVAYLNSDEALSRVADSLRGATRPRMTLEMLKATHIPIAPLQEQLRLVAMLHMQRSLVQRARAAAEAQREAARRLLMAVLRSAFSAEARREWPHRPRRG
jgi:type I restriction enzyme S subunit